ncbi:MAG: S66 peptidase family protein [Spirochaetales bacterium]
MVLQPGDTLAAVTLSWGGPGTIPHRYEAGKHQLQKEFGVRVVEMPHTLSDPEWIYRNPRARADDLMQAFADPQIKGIVSTIGGDESIRLLPWIDDTVIAANPKGFVGYSDTTVSHLACYRAGLRTFYGPSIMAGFGENAGMFEYTVDAVRRSMFSTEPFGRLEENRQGWTDEFLDWAEPSNQLRARKLYPSGGWRWIQGGDRAGSAGEEHPADGDDNRPARASHRAGGEAGAVTGAVKARAAGDGRDSAAAAGAVHGHLLGGCAEVLDQLRGTEVFPSREAWEGAFLFFETSEQGASPDFVTGFLRSLAAMGVIEGIRAVLFGRPGGGVPPERYAAYDEAILRVVRDEAGRDDIPVITGMDFGHTDPMTVLAYGAAATIDPNRREIRITEPLTDQRA